MIGVVVQSLPIVIVLCLQEDDLCIKGIQSLLLLLNEPRQLVDHVIMVLQHIPGSTPCFQVCRSSGHGCSESSCPSWQSPTRTQCMRTTQCQQQPCSMSNKSSKCWTSQEASIDWRAPTSTACSTCYKQDDQYLQQIRRQATTPYLSQFPLPQRWWLMWIAVAYIKSSIHRSLNVSPSIMALRFFPLSKIYSPVGYACA